MILLLIPLTKKDYIDFAVTVKQVEEKKKFKRVQLILVINTVKMFKFPLIVLFSLILLGDASPRGKKKDLEHKVINQSQEGECQILLDDLLCNIFE